MTPRSTIARREIPMLVNTDLIRAMDLDPPIDTGPALATMDHSPAPTAMAPTPTRTGLKLALTTTGPAQLITANTTPAIMDLRLEPIDPVLGSIALLSLASMAPSLLRVTMGLGLESMAPVLAPATTGPGPGSMALALVPVITDLVLVI